VKPSTRRLPIAACAVLGLLVLGGAARRLWAQNGVDQRFDQLDANGDRKVTPNELPAKALFQRLDLDGNGAITKLEAVEAVRTGALKDVRGPGSTPAAGATPFNAELAKPAPAEPPVREGPKPVRPGDHGIGRRVGDVTFTDVAGVSHTLAAIAKGRVVVFALTSTSCPISRKYLPTLEELVASTGDDVAWILVNPVATDKSADMQAAACRFADRFASRATYVHDPEGRLAAAIGAVTTTDVVVLAADRTVAYHGAIDDQYGFGYSIDAPRKRYLADAIAALRIGEEPLVAATEAPGCVLDVPVNDLPSKDLPSKEVPGTEVTYHGRISRIVGQHCGGCHRDGGVGPFPLDSYDDLVAHAGMVRQVVDRGTMPPWFAAPVPPDAENGRVHTPWANDRSLAESEKRDLLQWIAGGRPEGDPADAPAPKTYPVAWQIGTPDAVFEFAEPVAVKATGVMPYQTVFVETHLPEDRWVQAIEVQPGDRNVVHHALIHLVGTDDEAGDPRDTAADERGGFWGEYVPGQNVLVYPDGFAKKLPQGARMRFQMHYTPNGTATTDRTRVGVIYAKEPPRHEVRVAGIVNSKISIPPGVADHREEASLRLPFDATVMGFMPHLHVRGKACRYELVRGDGGRTTLLDIPRYDFNWQLLYRLYEPLALAAGDTLVFTAWYDNSAGNPANPDPTKTVRWGPQTFDEMQLGYVEYYVPGLPPGQAAPGLRRRPGGPSGPRRPQ
jgi:thiol-disulfide isomerase/thioredoxin